MTAQIKLLSAKHNIEFKAILHQIYNMMQKDYDIPLSQYHRDWLMQNPDKDPISLYQLITEHTELHELFEELVEYYEELFMPIATAVAIQFPV